MEKLFAVLEAVLPVMVALVLGFVARKSRVITPEGIEGIKKFVLKFTLPALVFYACFTSIMDLDKLFVVLCVTIAMLLSVVIGKLVYKLTRYKYSILPYFLGTNETGMMGYALYTSLFGVEYLNNMVVFDMGNMIGANIIWMPALIARQAQSTSQQKGVSRGSVVKSVFTNPILIAFLLGMTLNLTGAAAWLTATGCGEIILAIAPFISGPTSMAILFAVGYGMQFSKKNMKDAVVSCLLRMGMMLLLGTAVILILNQFGNIDSYMNWALVMAYTLPCSFALPLFAVGEEETEYVSTSVSLYILLTLIAYVVISTMAVGMA